MKRFLTVCAVPLLLCWAAAAGAGQQDQKLLDRDFLIKAVSCSHAEVRFSEHVENRTGNLKVKDFARKMAKDHTELNEKLSKISTEQRVAVLAGLEKDTKDTLDRLSRLSGTEFEREYLKIMVADHQRAIQLWETQVKYGKDTKLTDFAKATLPDLREHLKEAQALAADLNAK